MTPAEAHYRVPWRAGGHFPGHHASVQKGAGLAFRNHVALIDAPDPRRFDVRASLRDPFGQIQVRVYRQTSAIPVWVVADLSASMTFRGARRRRDVLADFVACLGYSAYRTGDRFGFVGSSDERTPPLLLPATMHRAASAALADRLRELPLTGRDSRGLLAAAESVGARRALVFLVSDFHFPLPLLEEVLASFAYHHVVPVILWDRYEYEDLPRFGLARVLDRELQRSRLLLMRPSLRKRIEERFAERRDTLHETFMRHGCRPLLLEDGFDADEVTRYFLG